MKSKIIHGNALDLPLEDQSVDLVITSPPYFALRSYRDGDEHYAGQIGSEATPQEFLESLLAATAEMVRVLKPAGSIWVNLGDKYAGSVGTTSGHRGGNLDQSDGYLEGRAASFRSQPNRTGIRNKSLMGLPWRYAIGCIDRLGLILRAEVIWSKPNGLPESVTDRVRRSHEQWFHFVKQGRYYSAVDEIREAHEPSTWARAQYSADKAFNARNSDGTINGGENSWAGPNPLGKLPGSVWTIPSEPLIVPPVLNLPDHFAAFPQEWPRRIILGWSPPGICTKCGEGRRPVVDKERIITWEDRKAAGEPIRQGTNGRRGGGNIPDEGPSVAIAGYACACDVAIAATTPATVLDPFCGTGTVPMVARALGRTGIGVDLSAAYCQLAEWRVFHSGHAAKAEDRTWAERQGTML